MLSKKGLAGCRLVPLALSQSIDPLKDTRWVDLPDAAPDFVEPDLMVVTD